MIKPQKKFMQAAIAEARKAKNSGDYAIGAVIVRNNKIIARGENRIKLDNDPTHHAEIVVIRKAVKKLKSRFLEECVLYTTHEPCPMCTSACIWSKMKGIVSGSSLEDMIEFGTKNGNLQWSWRTIKISASEIVKKGNPKLIHIKQFMREDCKILFHSS